MSIWGRIFAGMYDSVMARTEKAGLSAHRDALLSQATGDVLEVGAGTGANLARYGDGVTSLTLTEPEKPMARRLEKHLAERHPSAKLVSAPAEELPFDDDSFDTVVSTLVLCTVDDQPRALREMQRVLRPGGRLLFIEHVRAQEQKLARLQDRMAPINVRIAHGCMCNRATLEGIQNAGFSVTQVKHDTLKHAPPWVRPLIVGAADPARASREAPAGERERSPA